MNRKCWLIFPLIAFSLLLVGETKVSAQQISDSGAPSSSVRWEHGYIRRPDVKEIGYLRRRLSLNAAGLPLQKILDSISAKTGVAFSYGKRFVPDEKRISVSFKNVTVDQALNQICSKANIGWIAMGGNNVVITTRSDSHQKNGTIHGEIIDATSGDALPGANVLLKGTSMGASTSLNGRYTILNVPTGTYTLRVSYVGYTTREITIHVKGGAEGRENVKLMPVGVKGKTVVVTAQALGQNEAINQQLSSQQLVNVVSAARIRQLPDANAAESVGRLPGVYLLRTGGEGNEVAIRGLEPKYNVVTIDGVQMAATSTSNRAVDMSMISSSMLRGIQLYKTVTPDMDAAVLGGIVNFEIREARKNRYGGPEVQFSMQGGYNNLQNAYNDYKLTGTVGDRFLNDKFGILAQVVMENVNLTSDVFGGSYSLESKNFGVQNPLLMNSLTLTYHPRERKRYDGTVVMDYRLPHGKIDFMNLFSSGDTKTETRDQSYDLSNNTIVYGTGYSHNMLDVMTNLLDFQETISSFKFDVRLSHSYSSNNSPDDWSMNFKQTPAGLTTISQSEEPILIAAAGAQQADPGQLGFASVNTSNDFSLQRNITGSAYIQRGINLSDQITTTLKAGGKFRYTYRTYDQANAGGQIYNPGRAIDVTGILNAFPWMTKPPYNINPNGSERLPITLFEQPGFSYGKFLNGDYSMGPGTNIGLISQVIDTLVKVSENQGWDGAYQPSAYGNIASNYSGHEYESAGYLMATINIGPLVTLIPGVRYQGLETAYSAARVPATSAPNRYPLPYPHSDTIISEYHGYWLPDVSLKYKPLSWFSVYGAYTNTLTYPDFSDLIPRIDIGLSSVTWNNFALKPARSQNYDLALSLYDNNIGLLTVDGFLKQIDNLIFSQNSTFITNPSLYPGLPDYTKGFELSTAINNPNRVNLWGVEVDWQTHFWYLPWVFSGLVLHVNYTHIFSRAKYPYTLTEKSAIYPYPTTHVDTFYTDRMIDQPDNVVNMSIGYDYQDFSVVASMIYQANVFSGANFWPELRSYKRSYLRWDLVANQKLPWRGFSIYLNLNNLNGASDVYVVQGSGFPTSESDYGMTADIGVRWNLE